MKKLLQNLVLMLISVVLAYGICEFAFRTALPHLPLSVYNNLPRMYQLLGQTSKKEVMPRPPYLLIIGDSYAAGKGDWFSVDNQYDRNSRYQATHLLQDELGKDVLGVTQSGSGSFPQYYNVLNFFRFHAKRGQPVPLPDTKIFYFFAGNDIFDNLNFLEKFSPQAKQDMREGRLEAQVDQVYAQGSIYPFEMRFLVAQQVKNLLSSKAEKEGPDYGPEAVALLNGVETPIRAWPMIPYGGDPADLKLALDMFDVALGKVQREVPCRDSLVLFIPSPQDCYRLANGDDSGQKESDELAQKVEELALKNGYRFADSSAFFRAAAANELLHGPQDWWHLNRRGYEVLAEFILTQLPKATPLRD